MKATIPALSFIGVAAAAAQLLHARRDLGATPEEAAAVLPGDELVPEPAENTTLAVSVAATAEEVWAWLVQIGHGRGGLYSYDWLENLFGFDIHSAEEIHQELQHLGVGDRVAVVRQGYPAMPDGYAFTVAQIQPPRTIVLGQAPPEHPWNGVWSFHIVPTGAGRCRLLARSRTEVPPQLGLRLATRMGEPVTLFMTRRMLHGIRERAERRTGIAASGGE